jgi:hypothetical protein
MHHAVRYRASQSKAEAKAERVLSAQRVFEKPNASDVIGMGSDQAKIQVRGSSHESCPKQLSP